MRKVFTMILGLIICTCQAQDITRKNNPVEANAWINSLSGHLQDTVKIRKLIAIAYYHILKKGENKNDLDSAQVYIDLAWVLIKTRVHKPQMADLLIAQSQLFREKKMPLEGTKAIKRSLGILANVKDNKRSGLANFEMSQFYTNTVPEDLALKIHYLKEAADLFKKSRSLNLYAFSLKMLADVHNINGDREQALIEATLSLKIYQQTGERELQGIYELIGSIYYENGYYVKSLNYRLNALKIARLVGDTTMQFCQINNGIGMTYMRLKKFPDAIVYLKMALPVALKNKDRSSVMPLIFNIAESFISQGDPVNALDFLNDVPGQYRQIKDITEDFPIAVIYLEIFTIRKEVSKGARYSKQLRALAERPGTNVQVLPLIHKALTKYYTVAHDYKLAGKYIRKNHALLYKMNNAAGLAGNYESWFKLDTTQHNFRAAIDHLLLKQHLSDSISLENQRVDLKKVSNFYETAQKENALKLLQTRNRLQQIQIEHINYSRKWFLSLILTLFLVLVFFIRRYIIKRKMNDILHRKYSRTRLVNKNLTSEKSELLAEKDMLLVQKEWLLSEIHHRVRNNLHTIVSLLESQAVYLKNDALEAIEKSQSRIYALSLVHQKLYDDQHMKTVDFSAFIPDLTQYLDDTYNVRKKIKYQFNVDVVKIVISQAIPLALIINEVIINAIEHAFHKGSAGKIAISLKRSVKNVMLIITDDGIGISPVKITDRSSSLGLVLIKGLSDDIGARVNIENDQGTKVSICFEAEHTES